MPYWKYQLVAFPSGSTVPVSVAPLVEAPCAVPVWTAGGPVLPKVRSLPSSVPGGARRDEPEVVDPGVEAVRVAETSTAFVPEPALAAGVFEP